jgi:mannobiose 2-epimerase
VVSYGHDIETTWLLLDAAKALGRDSEPGLLQAALTMGQNAAEGGFDPALGGFFNEGVPGGAPTDKTKVWWVEFEALLGLFTLYQLDPRPTTLERFERTLGWLEKYQDLPHGEWFWGITEAGQPDEHGEAKGQEWKTSYHGLRALVFTADRLLAAIP